MNTKNNNENLVNNSSQSQEKNVNELTNQNFQFTIEGISFSYFDFFEHLSDGNLQLWNGLREVVGNKNFKINLSQDNRFLIEAVETLNSGLQDEVTEYIIDSYRDLFLEDYFGGIRNEFSERILDEIKEESPEYLRGYIIEQIISRFNNPTNKQ